MNWQIAGHTLLLGERTLVMGVVNVTPDSFSDGAQFFSVDSALAHALRMIDEGADIIDIGGESTRPGAGPISVEEELQRVIPLIEALTKQTTIPISIPISIDTTKSQVAAAALKAGAHFGISGGRNSQTRKCAQGDYEHDCRSDGKIKRFGSKGPRRSCMGVKAGCATW